jgi:exopolysaccharide biosynthesis WecB/TagA/CpsF family protein
MSTGKVRIFYPADPAGVVPGGIDTFIRGIIKWAPPELEFSLVGMSTDTKARPVGRWTRCKIGQREFDFFPVVAVSNAGGRGLLPLSLRFTVGAKRFNAKLCDDFDVFDFHRPEPSLLYLSDPRPKNAYWHQDPQTIAGVGSDNLWRRLPAGYARLEARAVSQFASAWCVRESGVKTLRERYPALGDQINFLPTWVDAEVFSPAPAQARASTRIALAQELGISLHSSWIIFVGRLDTQKNPALLLQSFIKVCRRGRDAVLLLVGDGVLKRDLQRQAKAAGVADRVHFLGLMPQPRIAKWLQAADLFALSSAYEGMPMALLEAMGCGTPAVVTDVGEVRRVVNSGNNGMVAGSHDAQAFAQAMGLALDNAAGWRDAAVQAVRTFSPAQVLAPVYCNYLKLVAEAQRLQQTVLAQDQQAGHSRTRQEVMGVPIDVLRGSSAIGRIMRWARAFESRTVCFANVHSTVLASRDKSHMLSLRSADLVVPDGAPVAWTLRRLGHAQQDRVDGPGTMWRLCAAAREHGVRIGLLGATPETLEALQATMSKRFPGVQIAYAYSPPFRQLSEAEGERICADVQAARVGLLYVGLGCPKQERWLAQHRDRIPAVMLGLGAAFDFHAGMVTRAPRWMRRYGLEWLHRLSAEPGRLWWRYLSSNSAFLWATLHNGALLGGTRRTAARAAKVQLAPPATVVSSVFVETRLTPEGDTGGPMSSPMQQRAIADLVARIDAQAPGRRSRIIGFLASKKGEGTSTVARAFAQSNAEAMGRNVLLLSTGVPSSDRPSVIDAVRDGQRIGDAFDKKSYSYTEASLGVRTDGKPSASWNLVASSELWRALRESFELVVVDIESAESSDAALKVAPLCDGVVVVVEAAKTRAPVVGQLLQNLNLVRARVLGTVLNKRRFHLPARLYRWL